MSKKTAAVALSGGVDSATAAHLLQQQGFSVIGLHLRLTDQLPSPTVKAVADWLKIPLTIIDLRSQFQKSVIDYFLTNYQKGYTPNPCIQCNKRIKFGFLFKKARTLGADYLATGHYIQLIKSRGQQKYYLSKAKDQSKDQSYFLYNLSSQQLPHLLFPLGRYLKTEIKAIARQAKIPVALSESQDICFIPDNDFRRFLKKGLKNKIKPGLILDWHGQKKLGWHQGLPFYTLGQRAPAGGQGPWWVVANDLAKNILWVSNQEKDIYSSQFPLSNLHWVNGQKPKFPLKCKVQTRYHAVELPCSVEKNKVILSRPARAIAPGQAAVFYQGQRLLGGGLIQKYD